MKNRSLSTIAAGFVALTVVSASFLSGCGSQRAEEPERVEPQADTAPAETVVEREAALAERERQLDDREQELSALAEEAEQQVQRLEARLEALDARKADLDAREASAEPALEGPVASVAAPEAAELVPAFATEPEPDPGPTTIMVKVPAGTELELKLFGGLSSETSPVGEPVRALVTADVIAAGRVAIPAGSEALGTVVEATPQKKIGGQAQLVVHFDRIVALDGYSAAIEATLVAAGKDQDRKDAAVIGGSTAGGAILGRILGDDGKGAVIGGILGAAAGAIAARENRGDPVILEPGARVAVALELPVHVAVADVEVPTAIALN